MPDTLTTLLREVEDNLIGLWRFRELGQPKTWCATYCYRGLYYDVQGVPTPEGALQQVKRDLANLRRRRWPSATRTTSK